MNMVNIKNIKKNKEKGFTLIELVVALAIFSLLISTLYNILDFGNNTYRTTTVEREAENEARIAMAYINVTFHQFDRTNGIVLQKPPAAASDTFIFNDPSGSEMLRVYYFSGKLKEKYATSASSHDIASISNFTVTPQSDGVSYLVTIQYLVGLQTKTLEEKIMKRSE